MDASQRLSARCHRIQPSATMALATKARQMQAAGRDVISLTAGEPDQDTPAPIVAAAKAAMDAGDTHYTGAGGVPELAAAILATMKKDGVELAGPGAVVATPGAKQAVFYAMQALVNPGDGVLLPEPAWVSYVENIGLAQGRVISVPLDPDQSFRLEAAPLIDAARASGGAKVLILNSPSNPTGRVLTEDEIEAVAEAAEALDLVVVSDEIYGRLVYAPHRFRRLAADPRLADRTVTIDGFSKAWAMTGWRLGWICGPEPLIAGARKLQSHTATCPASFVQRGGVVALEQCDEHVEGFLASFARRREVAVEAFSEVPGMRVPEVQGAFYAFLDVRGVGDGDDAAFCARALEEAEVAMVPGTAFGAAGKGFVRASFACGEDLLREAARRLTQMVQA